MRLLLFSVLAPVSVRAPFLMLMLCVFFQGGSIHLYATESVQESKAAYHDVQGYAVEGGAGLNTNSLSRILAPYTGAKVSLESIVEAAAAVQAECRKQGLPPMSVAIAEQRITSGIVPMYLFQGVTPQILISGRRYLSSGEKAELAAAKARELAARTNSAAISSTNAAETASAGAPEKASPKFAVKKILVFGNTLLSSETIKAVILPHMGTNVTVDDILKAATELQKEYRMRGYPTVSVSVPQQQVTSGEVKLRVFEGRLSQIVVSHNHYFSSNNVMRALPSLHTDVILNGQVFQAELNRANANQDRQIYPKIEPGPEENTTVLHLDVKDRLPLHGKVELNNENSPGTPELRVNTSVVYDNLWQAEHSLGFQYNFSPERYKTGQQWAFYDKPLVANYSGFYRLPLADPESIEDVIKANPGSFGFSEASRKFVLPNPTGVPELNLYASRATIDSGLIQTPVFSSSGSGSSTNGSSAPSLTENNFQEDLTVNQDIGARLTIPVRGTDNFQSSFSGGLDYKTFDILSNKTNAFTLTYIITSNNVPVPVGSTNFSTVPLTHNFMEYLPLSLRYDASLRDSLGVTLFGLGAIGNPWHSGSGAVVRSITGSARSTGNYFILNPSLQRDFYIFTNWDLTLRADGQWASEPLINTEQFGAGGVMSVRGYHEGETFGDTGWHVSLEQKTPPFIVGYVSPNNPLTVRASAYMDYAETFLLDPEGRPGSTSLWGIGFGTVATLGSHLEAHFLFSLPLLRSGTISPYQPYFNFALNAQF